MKTNSKTNTAVNWSSVKKSTQSPKQNAKKNQNPKVIDYLTILLTLIEIRRFLKEYNSLPKSCKDKIKNFIDLLNKKASFKILRYLKESESGYSYYELTRFSPRENVKPTREHIPAIGIITKLIDVYYDTDMTIDLDINKLIEHCEAKIAKKPVRTNRKATPKTKVESTLEETAN